MIKAASRIVQFPRGEIPVLQSKPKRPKDFTSREAFIDEVRERLLTSTDSYKTIAADCELAPATIQRLASGQTKWPSATTLWAVLGRLNCQITITPIR